MSQLELLPTTSSETIESQPFTVFLSVFLSVALVLPAVLWLLEEFSVRTYFTLCFIWLLISSEVFAPADPESIWWSRLRWAKLAGWLVFLAIVIERITLLVG